MHCSQSFLNYLLLGFSLILLGACQSIPQASPMMANVENIDLSSRELRLRLNDYTVRFTDRIEKTADEIIAKSDDDRIKRNALIWKIYGVPTAQQALFLSDPLAALADGWTFSIQLKHYFNSDLGKDDFGEWSHLGAEAAVILEKEAQKIASLLTASGDSAPAPKLVYGIAEKYPITSPMCYRVSIQEYSADLQGKKSSSLVSVAGEVAEGVNDLREHADYYVTQMPRRIRWEGEYLMDKAFERPELKQVIGDLAILAQALNTTVPIIEAAPGIIDSLFGRTIHEVDRQRLLILMSIAQERELILGAIESERSLILEDVDRQRRETIDEINLIRDSAVNDITALADDIIDRVFLRMAQVFGGLILFVFLGIVLLRLTKKKPGRE